MPQFRTTVLAGVAALCVAGTTLAASKNTHVMTVDLPNGLVARVEYQGDVKPKVRIDPAPRLTTVRFNESFMLPPVAMFDRIVADLDRQASMMTRQARALQQQRLDPSANSNAAALREMPAGTVTYHYVATTDGGRVCSQSWQYSSQGPGQQPKLSSTSSGDCSEHNSAVAPSAGARSRNRATASRIAAPATT